MGQFPRHVVTSVAGLSAQDISRPLKHSFIHTGHGDTDPHRSWGHADHIDRLTKMTTLSISASAAAAVATRGRWGAALHRYNEIIGVNEECCSITQLPLSLIPELFKSMNSSY